MSKLILTEYYEMSIEPELIQEAMNTSGPLVLRNRLLQKANTKNHNGRIYPTDILVKEVKKYASLVNERRALGELDHPDSPTIELNNVSHLITSIQMEGEEVRGDIEILPTPKGQILKNLILAKVKLGVSSRGIGSLQKEGLGDTDVVQDDFELICFDAVSSPSTPGAYLVNEGALKSMTKDNRLQAVLYDILKEKYFN